LRQPVGGQATGSGRFIRGQRVRAARELIAQGRVVEQPNTPCEERWQGAQICTILPQNPGLPLVRAEQNDDRAFTGALTLLPVGRERGAPHRHGALEPILAGTTAGEDDQAAHGLGRQLRAPGAFPVQINLALLGERDAVDELGNRAPRPEARRGEHLPEQVGIGHSPRERDGGLHGGRLSALNLAFLRHRRSPRRNRLLWIPLPEAWRSTSPSTRRSRPRWSGSCRAWDSNARRAPCRAWPNRAILFAASRR